MPDPRPSPLHNKSVGLFLAGAFVPVIALMVFSAAHGGLAATPWVPIVAMFVPAISAIAVQRLVLREPIRAGLGLRWPGWRALVGAWAAMVALVTAALAISIALTPGLLVHGDAVVRAASHVGLPIADPLTRIAAGLAVTVTIGPVLAILLTLGEEIGWRGFLMPRLVARFGRRGVVLASAIWGVWHAPAIVLLGYNYPVTRWPGLVLFTLICIALGLIFSIAMLRSRSVLTPALMHATLNQLAMAATITLFDGNAWVDWRDAPTGVIMLAVLALPAWAAWRVLPRYPFPQ